MSGGPGAGSESCRRAFAARIEADREEIMAAFAREMEASDSPIFRDPALRGQIMENGRQILTDVIESVRAGRVRLDENYKLQARETGLARAASGLHARESLRAAIVFFEAALIPLSRDVGDDTEALKSFQLAMQALHRSLHMRIREAATTFTGYLLNRIHEAHLGERRRIARELHDRVGSGLSVAHRQLELFDVYLEKEPVKAAGRAEKAHQAVRESMNSLRAVTSDLRAEAPLMSLEKTLVRFVESVPADDVYLHLRINGDETWAPTAVRDEAFLIIREAIRNALAHGAPTMVLISVDIAPHELRAMIEDNGTGFDRAESAASGGIGLTSMRERAALLGGTVTVATQQDQGTQVELVVPLPAYQEDNEDESADGTERPQASQSERDDLSPET